jgi:orotidine-5'-phosphate decarboxylase
MKINNNFITTISKNITKKKSHICVGLDSDYEKIPAVLKKDKSVEEAIFSFNKEIIDNTYDICVAYKCNNSFYAGFGFEGLRALKKTNEYIKKTYPEMKILADCKRSEMKRSAEMVAKELFEELKFDGFTVTPWFGFDTLEPYQNYQGKVCFVLCHDSNPSAYEVQDVELNNGRKLYEHVTDLVCQKWNSSGNILIEAPLTYPKILKAIKERSKSDQFFLIAGLGAQGGEIKDLSIFKKDKNFIINASRSIIFASEGEDFAQKAREQVLKYNKEIEEILYG